MKRPTVNNIMKASTPHCYWTAHTHSKLFMEGSSYPSDTNIKRWKGGGAKTLNTFEAKIDRSAIVDSDNSQYKIVEYFESIAPL